MKSKPSLSYYFLLLILKLKGVKKEFSKTTIDYKKIRKKDVHEPSKRYLGKIKSNRFKIKNTGVSVFESENDEENLIIFVHGGAYISGPAKHHWDAIKKIHKTTDFNVWLCDYPKAPEHKITEISKNLDLVYKYAQSIYDSKKIIMIGDSVGASLIISLTQRLVQLQLNLPNKLILISPVMDASMTNPEIYQIDKTDPMLGFKGVLSAKLMCAENGDVESPLISPIHGDFDGFPKTMIFLAENDITYPDQKLALLKMRNANIPLEVQIGEKMPHIWPILPIMKEAKTALNEIIESIRK